ncbi:hypothetical protein, partial [Mycobacterium avium]|uniref:hypothetical protein n=1 Tax=Mycobacterium avium TaxID=1764 RepID=UPI001F214179
PPEFKDECCRRGFGCSVRKYPAEPRALLACEHILRSGALAVAGDRQRSGGDSAATVRSFEKLVTLR